MKSNFGKALVMIALLAAIAGVLALKSKQTGSAPPVTQETAVPAQQGAAETPVNEAQKTQPPTGGMTPSSTPVTKSPSISAPATGSPPPKHTTTPAVSPSTATPAPVKAQALPRLLELGADKCVPCKMMQPVLAELRQNYGGKLQVDFIDVWKDPSAGEPYGVRAIPTQIFFDAAGKEIFRHTGFYPKEEILAKFKEFGITL